MEVLKYSYLKSIMKNDGTKENVEIIGHRNSGEENIGESLFVEKGEPLININIDCDRELNETLNILNSLEIKECDNILLDSKLLEDEKIINILREKCNNKRITLRIVGDNYILSKEDIQKLSFAQILIANNSNKIVSENPYIINYNSNQYITDLNLIEEEINYYITNSTNINDLLHMVEAINNNMPAQLFIKIYDNKKCLEIMKILKEKGINSNIEINILGNPLYDSKKEIDEISNILPNKIKVVYNTCQDIINIYTKEPHIKDNFYYSELEGGGITDINNYKNIIEVLTEEENHIKQMHYSPLETIIYAYNYLKENYTYETNDTNNPIETRSLEFIVKRDKIVCVGFATLFSALMRRCNIPVFRYSCDKHVKNIGRIKDNKYNIDLITTFDPTNDIAISDETKQDYLYRYEHFGVSPYETLRTEQPDILTIAASLVLDKFTYSTLFDIASSKFVKQLQLNYHPMNYTVRMLELMVYNFEEYTIEGIYKLLEELKENNCFDEINPETTKNALYEVLLKENKITNKEIISKIENDYYNSINQKLIDYSYPSAIKTTTQSEKIIDINVERKISKRALKLYEIILFSDNELEIETAQNDLTHYLLSTGLKLEDIRYAYNNQGGSLYIK